MEPSARPAMNCSSSTPFSSERPGPRTDPAPLRRLAARAAQRAHDPVARAVGQAGDELLEQYPVLLRKARARDEPDAGGIRVVEVGPVRPAPLEGRREGGV